MYSTKVYLYVKFEVPLTDGTVAINVLKENNKYGYQIEDIHHNHIIAYVHFQGA